MNLVDILNTQGLEICYGWDISDCFNTIYEPQMEEYIGEYFDDADWDEFEWKNLRPLARFLEDYVGLVTVENDELKLLPYVLNIHNLTPKEYSSPLTLSVLQKCEIVSFDDFKDRITPYLNDVMISWGVHHTVEDSDEDETHFRKVRRHTTGTEYIFRDYVDISEVIEHLYHPEPHLLPENSEMRMVGIPQCMQFQ